ncbi:Ig-like domain-containing protein [Paenibacillus algorifonticola]|uniref:Ig-like domain-containing protein n=1 Tax=Paenibacillus algorifonticola TaxID=684063 RepID=A0A1I2FKB9_9BACL|nr:Ig-like domain-containing protein [Paenibacillus algorifonticola]SFF05735.1 Ig-like domain-containing protein [Paenibacillus algorifonticola]
MNNYLRKMAVFSRSKGPSLLLCTAVLGTTLSFSTMAEAASGPSNYFLPVVNNDMQWVKPSSNYGPGSGSEIITSDSSIKLDTTKLFTQATVVILSASSSDANVASVNVQLPYIDIEILAAGTTEIKIEGVTTGNEKLIEHFRVTVDRFADTNRDGMVTSADALLIARAVDRNTVLTPGEANLFDINRDGAVTAADATALMNLYTGKTALNSTEKYIVTLSSIDDAPAVYNTSLSADSWAPGETATAQYSYFDAENHPEGNTRIKWFRGTLADGSDRTEINGEMAHVYSLQLADVNHYVFAEVTPVAASGDLLTGQTVLIKSDSIVMSANPIIVSRTPENESVNVNRNNDIVFTFDREVTAVPGKLIQFYYVGPNSPGLNYLANDTSNIEVNGKTVTIKNLTGKLPWETQFSLVISAGAFEDASGNEFAGIAFSEWVFTTGVPD